LLIKNYFTIIPVISVILSQRRSLPARLTEAMAKRAGRQGSRFHMPCPFYHGILHSTA